MRHVRGLSKLVKIKIPKNPYVNLIIILHSDLVPCGASHFGQLLAAQPSMT